ncbi:MAG TPA: hypothetical protein VMU50_15260 [Polyangia bacterium]|nr:hypothetical protein [Polyangia bacterium]
MDDDDVRRLLRGLRVDPADGGFREALHRRLGAEAPPARRGLGAAARAAFARWPGLLWPATGVLSGAAAFAILMALRTPVVPQAAPVAAPAAATVAEAETETIHRLPADKTAVIRINFATEVAVDNVTFDVTLPEGLSFWSQGQKLAFRSFRWQGQLSAGDNPIPIAVRGDRPGRYRVRAAAEVAGARIEHEVVLEVEGA